MINFFYFGVSLLLMLVVGTPLIAWLKRLRGMKWSPREDTPDSHLQKTGTPSMGGIGIIGAALTGYFVVLLGLRSQSQDNNQMPWIGNAWLIALILLLPLYVGFHALLGFIDDWSKARGKGGLLARQKLVGQVLLSVVFAVSWLYVGLMIDKHTDLYIHPNVYKYFWPSAFMAAIFWSLILIGTSNAVNLTDGIDGLATGLSLECAIAFFFINDQPSRFSPYYHEVFTHYSVAFWLALGGACLGFLAYNKNPAKVFMGDTGSLALGAALGAGAILTRSVFLLPFIGFIFYVEMFSVIFQVAYFKYTRKKTGEGKRIFRRAPLHHHFELGGWSEKRVVATFWAVNLFTTVVGLILWKTGVLPRFP